MTDNIADKARAYLALSKAATPKPWYAEGRGGAQMDGLRDGYEIYSTEHPKIARLFDTTTGRSGKANDANLIVLGRNIGDEMAEALLVAVEALMEVARSDPYDGADHMATVASGALRKLGIGADDE